LAAPSEELASDSSSNLASDRWWHLRLRGLSSNARHLLLGKSLRAFADGLVSVVLPIYLLRLGYSAFAVGAIVTSTLLGSAALTLAVGFFARRIAGRRVLLYASLLMAVTGIGFATVRHFWPLLIVAFVGTINPSSGDGASFCRWSRHCWLERWRPGAVQPYSRAIA
jgi:MFS family permease